MDHPGRAGYGTSVIRELIPFALGGAVDLAFGRDCVRCRLEIPAEWLSPGHPLSAETQGRPGEPPWQFQTTSSYMAHSLKDLC